MVVDKNNAILEGETVLGKFETWSKQAEEVVNSVRNGKPIADHTAVICGQKVYTFEEINKIANRLARGLVKEIRKHCPDMAPSNNNFICTFGGNSDVHIIEWLAINKLGVGVMALVPSTAGDTVQSLLKVTHPLCLLVDMNFKDDLKEKKLDISMSGTTVLYFQDLLMEYADADDKNLEDCERLQVAKPEGLFYITTTSGTSGTPKLVPVSHKAFSDNLAWQLRRLKIGDGSVFLNRNAIITNTLDTILPLVTGYPQVVLTGAQIKNPEAVVDTINKYKVTCIPFISPSFLANMLLYLQYQSDPQSCRSLRWVECSSEILHDKVVKDFFDYFTEGTELYNGWGMVETAGQVIVVHHFREAKDLEDGCFGGKSCIGAPAHNTNVYIVDDELNLLKKGEKGHFCVSGSCVLGGYLNLDKTETIKKNLFTQNPLHEHLFMTGDFARIINDCVIFEGRQAHLLKVRGFSVHIGEVEACIYKHLPGIKSACVRGIESRGNQTELVCFYVPEEGASVKETDIVAVCKEHLEEYKVPMAVHCIDRIPVQPPNDNINVKRLAEIHREWKDKAVPMEEIPPKDLDPVMDILFSIVSESFGIPRHCLNENSRLSDIGGTSINIVWVWDKLKQAGFDVRMTDILGSKTLSEILSKMRNYNVMKNFEDQEKDLYEVVDLFQQSDAEDCLPLVAHNFAERNDVFKRAGADYNVVLGVLHMFWDKFKESNFSSAIRDKKTGKYLAVTLSLTQTCEDEIDYDAFIETYPCVKAIVMVMMTVEQPMKELLKQLPPETLNSWFVGVDPNLGPDETLKLIRIIDDYDRQRAKEAGFKRICGTAMHPVTKATWEESGCATVHVVATRDIDIDGVKLFGDLPEDHVMAAQLMSLQDTNEHDIIMEALREGKTTLKGF